MLSTNTSIQTALSGLQAYQTAIDTTGENIANANTAGYSRQRVTLTESAPLSVPGISRNDGTGAQVGTGVSIDGISRVRDQFLDIQYRTANGSSSYDSEMASQLADVQTALGDSSTSGTSAALSSFWSSWNSLASNPGSAAQGNVVAAGQTLAGTLNSVAQQISTVQSQAQTSLNTYTQAGGEIDQDAQQLTTLNTQIKHQLASGQTPNTLLDARDKIIDELSGLANTTATQDSNGDGGVTVTFGGQTLVDSSGAHSPLAATSFSKASGGTLGALADTASATGTAGTLLSQLNTVAANLASTVNGTLSPSGTSSFFTTSDGSTTVTAGNISVATTAATLTASASSDTVNTLAANSGGPVDQGYAAFVNSVGTAAQGASTSSTTSTAVTASIDSQRQSTSGVSLDEEMANLITFQQGYQASARVMSTQDDMINTLLSVVGAGL